MSRIILKVMCAKRIVLNPRETPKATNISIREIPVTMSEFSIGMLLIPMKMVFGAFLILLMPMAAAVPRIVAIRAERKAMIRVL